MSTVEKLKIVGDCHKDSLHHSVLVDLLSQDQHKEH